MPIYSRHFGKWVEVLGQRRYEAVRELFAPADKTGLYPILGDLLPTERIENKSRNAVRTFPVTELFETVRR